MGRLSQSPSIALAERKSGCGRETMVVQIIVLAFLVWGACGEEAGLFFAR
ncbi:MAG: hypothetical protein AAFO73_02960 [Pseudomonadota bacterium]